MAGRGGVGSRASDESMAYIRRAFLVPAREGVRVRTYDGRRGVIVGASGAYIRVRLDGEGCATGYHPTWEIEYDGGAPDLARATHPLVGGD